MSFEQTRAAGPADATDNAERPWLTLQSIAEVEQWIAGFDQELQAYLADAGVAHPVGPGICFTLAAGGALYLHTNNDGDVLLDVTPEAEWVGPLITAATRVAAPRGQVWLLPGDTLVQLVLGLNSLIAASRLVASHRYRVSRG